MASEEAYEAVQETKNIRLDEDRAVRLKMVKIRTDAGITVHNMAKMIGMGAHLLEMIELGWVTHPKIAKKIGAIYKLTPIETEALMPVCRRVHGGDYEPNRYVSKWDDVK